MLKSLVVARKAEPRRTITRDLTGLTFGWLTALRPTRFRTCSSGAVIWECVCVCGKELQRSSALLLRKDRGPVGGGRQSCGCSRQKVKSLKYKGVGGLSGSKWNCIKHAAKKRGLDFEITIKEAWDCLIEQGMTCAVSGLPIRLEPNEWRAGISTASLDRIDSTKGYVRGNIQWVHMMVNMMKRHMTTENLVNWCRLVVAHNQEVPNSTPVPVRLFGKRGSDPCLEMVSWISAMSPRSEFGMNKKKSKIPGLQHLKDVPEYSY